ncbi:hypothetical protein [Streptomyces cacaoi]|uniref:Secreted protein n=1 Tax=Streptomyces cacaoi TaxID=1898 RepID=A0A4Y3QY98_STRCI|nr:hypothetical protein [Streptomyces cacaoi]GEB50426.1 hypothetical protein SCA03_29770 [Streptomyces cacaoi]
MRKTLVSSLVGALASAAVAFGIGVHVGHTQAPAVDPVVTYNDGWLDGQADLREEEAQAGRELPSAR